MSMPTLAWPGPCQDRHGHGRGRRPILVTGVPAPPHAPALPPSTPHLPLHLSSTTRRRRSNRTAAALTRQALADAPPRPCAAGTPSSAPPPPHGPVRRRGCDRRAPPVPPLPQRPATVATTRGRHLAAALTTATARTAYKTATPAPLRAPHHPSHSL